MPRGGMRLRGQNGQMNMIGNRVLARRKALRLTRETTIARIAAVTHGECNLGTADLARIENETRAVITTELLAIAEVLEMTPHELLGGVSWTEASVNAKEAHNSPPRATKGNK